MRKRMMPLLLIWLAALPLAAGVCDSWQLTLNDEENSIDAIGSNEHLFIATTREGYLYVSYDGTEWVKRPFPKVLVDRILWDGKRFLAVGQDLESNSGRIVVGYPGNWITIEVEDYRVRDVAFNGDTYMAVASSGLLSSSNGLNWNFHPSEVSFFTSIAWSRGRFVATSYGAVSTVSLQGEVLETATYSQLVFPSVAANDDVFAVAGSEMLVPLIMICPPSGMASRAFRIKFWMTWLIWLLSIKAGFKFSTRLNSHLMLDPVSGNAALVLTISASETTFLCWTPPCEKVSS